MCALSSFLSSPASAATKKENKLFMKLINNNFKLLLQDFECFIYSCTYVMHLNMYAL